MKENWKTTVAGILAGIGPILNGLASTLTANEPVNWHQLTLGFGLMVLGVLARDATPKSKATIEKP